MSRDSESNFKKNAPGRDGTQWEPCLYGLLIVAITVTWCVIYGRTSTAAWKTPISYSSDTPFLLAYSRAFLNGDIFPVLQKFVKSLNAPFVANWNDFAVTEEFIYAAVGWLGRGIGLFASANVMLLLAHVFAGLSFFWVARVLRYRRALSFAGAVLFAFSPFILRRSLVHLALANYWHVPLFLLTTWWVYSGRIALWGRKWWFAAAVSFVTGLLNPYYTCMYVQFLGFGVLLHLVRKQRSEAAMDFGLGCLAMAAFLLMNVDTISYSIQNGSNTLAGVRHLNELVVYGLKLPDIFMPSPSHRWGWWASIGQSRYYLVSGSQGEAWYPYFGFVGLVGFAWLTTMSVFRLFQCKLIPVQAWQTLWVLAFSLVGGVNLIFGVLGCTYFRASNRMSIIILCISLLFLVRQLSRRCPRRLVLPVAALMLAVGLADQLPSVSPYAVTEHIAQQVRSDREFTAGMESALPPGTMVFQLPTVPYPESPPINNMNDYEHFIPYLYSKHLRFSYGTNKGRALETWQKDVENLPPAEMAATLEQYGFGAIYINTRGYKDEGAKLISDLADAGKPVLLVSSIKDLVAVRLTPAAVPYTPPLWGAGWSTLEPGGNRWSVARRATVDFWNTEKESVYVSLQFNLTTLRPRHIRITLNSGLFDDLDLQANAVRMIGPKTVTLSPGRNTMLFETDVPPALPGNGDTRELSFQVGSMREAPVRANTSKEPTPLSAGDRVEFSSMGGGTGYLLDGWTTPESWGVWTNGKEARIKLPINANGGIIKEISLEVNALVSPQHKEQSVDLWLDDEKVQSFSLKSYSDNMMKIGIPESARKTGAIRNYHLLRFSILNPVRPVDIGMGPDSRSLGLGLKALSLH